MTAEQSTHLLDVNVLVALVDPAHIHHDPAHQWFERVGSVNFATCPLTENGLLRVVGHPRYPHSPGSPAAVASLLADIRRLPGHHFWPDSISLADDHRVDVDLLTAPAQLTDVYLLALAVANQGTLSTFDGRLATPAVQGGAQALTVISPSSA